MSSFFNDIEISESPNSVFNCYNKKSFPTYEQFLPFTELTVSLANDAIERDLGRIDMFTACDFILKRELSPEAMLAAVMYINRFKRRKELNSKKISTFTSADLFLISMMLASKYLFDDGTEENVVNEEWAEDFGIENKEVNTLEVDFLNSMDWRLHIEPSEYMKCKQNVGAYLAQISWNLHDLAGSTYRELIIIHDHMKDEEKKIVKFVELLCKAIVGCVVVYAGVIVGVHLMVFTVYARPNMLNHQWNMEDKHHQTNVPPLLSFNESKDRILEYGDINESEKYHSTSSSYLFTVRSRLSLTTVIEQ